MSADLSATERIALGTARAAVHYPNPDMDVVEQIVRGLSHAGLLQSPETAAELERLRAERHTTNEALADLTVSARAERDALLTAQDGVRS